MVSAVPGYGTKTLANLLEVVESTLLLFNLHMYPVRRQSKKNRRNLSEQLTASVRFVSLRYSLVSKLSGARNACLDMRGSV